MPAFLKSVAISLSCLCVVACSGEPVTTDTSAPSQPQVSVGDQIRELDGVSNDEAVASAITNAEKLVALMGVEMAAKTGILVNLDSTIESLRAVGKTADADIISDNRQLLLQAFDIHSDEFVDLAVGIYQDTFTEAELMRLVDVYSDPVMQKMVAQQVNLTADLTDVIVPWTETVGNTFGRLVEEKE